MANTDNLISFNRMQPDRLREISRKGGRASGAARRAKRERIEHEKAVQRAERELFRETTKILCDCTRLLYIIDKRT